MAEIINGRAVSRTIFQSVQANVQRLADEHGLQPGLAVVLVGNDPASEVYVNRKLKECDKVGINSFEHRLPGETSEKDLLDLIDRLNNNQAVHGILVQLPLPPQINAAKVLDAIAPEKDVDGFHPVNVGRLSIGAGGLTPCTPLGVMKLLDGVIDDYRGLNAVVIGKSNIVGKPIALLLLEREATVTVTHIETLGLSEITRNADIIVAAAGAPRLVRGYWVKEGAVIIDVGITRIQLDDGKTQLVGDVCFDEVQHARAVTPVPGGVGPMTIACLLENTLKACANTVINSDHAEPA